MDAILFILNISFKRLLATVLLLSLAACAGPNNKPATEISAAAASNSSAEFIRTDMVATDLISALMQLNEFPPWATTIQMSESNSPFGKALFETFKSSGFGVQQVIADSGPNNVSHSRSVITTERGKKYRYTIGIREIEIFRDFDIRDDLIFPVSPIYVSGSDVQNITPNDELYRQQGGVGSNAVSFPSGVEFIAADGSTIKFKNYTVKVNPGSKRSADESISNQRILIAARSRVLFTKKISTSVDVRDWTAFKQVILNFPSSDTSILGNNNKTAITQLISTFDSEQHGMSITGCAANKSLLWDGTELDSLDRQRRVFDELLVSGIPAGLVAENGCFGSQFNDLVPKQGVVLTMRVRAENI